MFHKRWTPEEENVLKQMYGIKSVQVLSELLDKTENAIRKKAKNLGLKRPTTYSEQMCRLEDEFDGGNYYRKLDYAKMLDSSIEYVSDAWAKYGRENFELKFKKYTDG